MLNNLKGNESVNLNGYEKLNWNDSIRKLKLFYPDIHFLKKDINRKCFINKKENPLNNDFLIKKFWFSKNKLESVEVYYGVLSLHQAGLVEYKLFNHYGKFDWVIGIKNEIGTRIKQGINIVNENLRIILLIELIKNSNNNFTYNHVSCFYDNRNNDKRLNLFNTDNFDVFNKIEYSIIEL